MRMNIKIGLLILLGISSVPLAAQQTEAIRGWCEKGGAKVVTQGMNSTTSVQASYPKCSVLVYSTGTTDRATIYADANGTILTNPFTANTDGSWLFYVAASYGYDIVLSGGTPVPFPIPSTLTDVVSGGPVGLTPNLTAGTTTTLAPGSQATVTITGTPEVPLLNLGIPSGLTGPQGPIGDANAVGAVGSIQATDGSGNFRVATGANVTTTLQGTAQNYPGVVTFGDSIAYGNDASVVGDVNTDDDTYGFTNITMRKLGGIGINYAQGADTSRDLAQNHIYQSLLETLAPSDNGFIYIGNEGLTNDASQYLGSTNEQLITTRAVLSNLEFRSVPTVDKIAASSCSLSSGWTADTSYPSINEFGSGEISTTTGNTVSCSVPVGPQGDITGAYVIADGNTGTFTVHIGGTSENDPISGSATWINAGDGGATISTSNGTTFFPAGFRLVNPAWANTTQTIIFTKANGTGSLAVEWVGSHPAANIVHPKIFTANAPQYASGGSCGTTSTFISTYNTILANVAAELTTDGANIAVTDAYTVLGANPGTSGYFTPGRDCIHPSGGAGGGGHNVLSTAMLATAPATFPATTLSTFQSTNYDATQLGVFQGVPVTDQPALMWTPNMQSNFGDCNQWGPGIGWLVSPSKGADFSAYDYCPASGFNGGLVHVMPNNGTETWATYDPDHSGRVTPSNANGLVTISGLGINVGNDVTGIFSFGANENGVTLGYNNSAGSFTSYFGQFDVEQFAQATSSNNYNSPIFNLVAGAWNGGSAHPGFSSQVFVGGGTNPAVAYTVLAEGSGVTGPIGVDFTGTVLNGGQFLLPSATLVGGQTFQTPAFTSGGVSKTCTTYPTVVNGIVTGC